jgi:diguanylate cyclase (GGDEF)-like protein
MNFIEFFNRKSKRFLILLGSFLILAVGLIDYLIASEIGFSLFYLPAIFLTTWFVGTWAGILTSFISALTWLAIDLIKVKPYSFSFTPYWNALVRLGFFLIVVFLQRALRNEQMLARMDPLTKIVNRRYFFKLADNEISKSKRYERPFSVSYIDIDNFKNVNDRFGHKAGDNLLRTVTDTISKNIRSTDIFARLGGDEFILLFPEIKADEAREAVCKLQKLLMTAMKNNRWPVTFSFGVVTFLTSPGNPDNMIMKADRLMYSAKKAGKNLIKYEIF